MERRIVWVPHRFNHLEPQSCDLIRLGGPNDGGYVIGRRSLDRSQSLLSLGIATEWSFDADFLRHRRKARYIACDRASGTAVHLLNALRQFLSLQQWKVISKSLRVARNFFFHVPPWNQRRKFVRRWVRGTVVDQRRDVELNDLLALVGDATPVFLKMDIEGGEYALIPEITRRESARPGFFAGLCIEFHDISAQEPEFLQAIEHLQRHFHVVNVHANNYVPITGDFPKVIELSFVPIADVTVRSGFGGRRGEFDAPNNPDEADIELRFLST